MTYTYGFKRFFPNGLLLGPYCSIAPVTPSGHPNEWPLDLERPIFYRFRLDPFLSPGYLVVDPVVVPLDLFRVPGKQLAVPLREGRVGGADVFRLEDVAMVLDERKVLFQCLLPEGGLQAKRPEGRIPLSQSWSSGQARFIESLGQPVHERLRPLDLVLQTDAADASFFDRKEP